MTFNIVTHIQTCFDYYTNNLPLNLIYYSHIPTAILSLIVGFFVFFKTKRSMAGMLLLCISITFSLWSLMDLVTWTSFDSRWTMFAWSLLGILNVLVFVFCYYFVYVYIVKKDLPFLHKIILFVGFLPIIILTSTKQNLTGFDVTNCESTEGTFFTNYYYIISLIIFLWILFFIIYQFRKASKESRKEIIFLTIGIELFLFAFFTTGFLNSYLVSTGYITDVASYKLAAYGLFGMPIFMTFLGYLIVKFKAFNIKLIAAQALVAALIILIASQFAFIESNTNKILTAVTLVLSVIGGYVLVKSVQMEVERKEQLQIMTNKLSQANDKLRVLDNAKSEFISIASHQLRTPLTAVKGYASLLLEGSYGKVDGKQKDVLNKMYQSNERLIALVEDMLNLSRIESGRMEYKFEDIEIEGVLQEIYDTFVLRAKERNLSFELVKAEKPLPKVKTDRNKIREIISNFTDNAIKYTPEGGVKLKAYERDRKVIVAVSDTGIGIPKEEIPYLFEKFSRGKDTSRLNAGGTGLGLHVGIKMIEELHGKIRVESEGAGKGSTFFVELPVG